MPLQQLLNTTDPRKLFLIDSLGALLSAFMLGVVLVELESFFGMPAKVLYYLAFVACVFAGYSFLCYRYVEKNWRRYMSIIAIVNVLYCVVTLYLVVNLHPQLTLWGQIYFILEVMIVVALALVELKIANHPAAQISRLGLGRE